MSAPWNRKPDDQYSPECLLDRRTHQPTSFICTAVLFVGVWCLAYLTAHGASVQRQVALLDGTPVYEWRVFKSVYSDPVDRALVLRDFRRRGFTLPRRFAAQGVQEVAVRDFGGDMGKLKQALERKGATLDDYKRFRWEEMIIVALPRSLAQRMRGSEPAWTEARWLAELRREARIKRLRPTRAKMEVR